MKTHQPNRGKGLFKITKASQVKHALNPGLYHVNSTGLYYRVATHGKPGTWVQRIHIDGGRRQVKLGRFPHLGYADAVAQAAQNYQRVQLGQDVVSQTRARQVQKVQAVKGVPTFAAVNQTLFDQRAATVWLEKGGPDSRSASDWQGTMTNHVLSQIGTLPIDQIDRVQVLALLDPYWKIRKGDTAPRINKGHDVRAKMKQVFDFAISRGHIDRNPAGKMIESALPPKPKAVHRAAIDWREVPDAMKAIAGCDKPLSFRAALQFIILTGGRKAETLNMTWEEIDGTTWKIPAARMKGKRDHEVPLSTAALEVLESVRHLTGGTGPVFPSARKGCKMSPDTPMRILRELKIPAHVHGFRNTFRDWVAETGRDGEAAEVSLAHAKGAVEAAYQRSAMTERRRPLMEEWAAHCTGKPKVAALKVA